MHVALDPPLGQAADAAGSQPGSTIDVNRSSTYPSTEQTLSSLSVVVNAGGSGQIGDFIHSTATALSGREGDVRELISRLDTFVGTVDEQRDRFTASIQALDRLTDDVGGPEGTTSPTPCRRSHRHSMSCCRSGPVSSPRCRSSGSSATPRPNSSNTTQDDLVHNLTNLEPTLKALADVGPYLDTVLAFLPTFPFSAELHRPRDSRRLRQHLRDDGPDDPPAQAFAVPRHPVGRPERSR